MRIRSVVLAAGQGTRMRSDQPKVLHPILGKPLVWFALETARQVSGDKPVVVIGHGADAVRAALGSDVEFVLQAQQLGTGHAVMQAAPLLRGKSDLVLVTYADMPLITSQTLQTLVQIHQTHAGPITMATLLAEDPRGFGRIVRGPEGQVAAIVEEAQATPQQLTIRELNPGVYCFSADWLWQALERIPLSPKGEYYLTDLVGIAVSDGLWVQGVPVADPEEMIGINNRVHLAEAGIILRRRINQAWMLEGVSLVDPANTYIEPGVQIGRDTFIWPNTYLHGSTIVGMGCELGPNTIIRQSKIGDRCKILASVLEGAVLEDDVDMGPFARLRKGAHLGKGVHMGNFGEIKNSYLAPGVKMGHFSYIGDATIGEEVNIGAGTITCNYDGEKKHPTVIGKDAFIGSDTMLVAPVTIGERARTGAGAVVTHDVPADTVVVGVPARPLQKKNNAT
jgi:bifunctional UDP-N-acetylglucosamine pyrophosphorylase / glucosamine-1-phosphate N-acetyltransferase